MTLEVGLYFNLSHFFVQKESGHTNIIAVGLCYGIGVINGGPYLRAILIQLIGKDRAYPMTTVNASFKTTFNFESRFK